MSNGFTMTNARSSGSAAAGALSQAPRRIVLFDFDGVIVHGDAFGRFLRDRYARAWWRVLVALPLLPLCLLASIAPAGRRGLMRAVAWWALAGIGAARYRTLARSSGRALARDARNISRAACAALNAHRHADDRVLVVTACEETLARAVLDELGFDQVELIGSKLAGGRCGLRVAPHNRGVEKARLLARRGVRPPWDIAYSGSIEDLPILAAARAATLVNPDRATLARVSGRLGRRVAVVEWR